MSLRLYSAFVGSPENGSDLVLAATSMRARHVAWRHGAACVGAYFDVRARFVCELKGPLFTAVLSAVPGPVLVDQVIDDDRCRRLAGFSGDSRSELRCGGCELSRFESLPLSVLCEECRRCGYCGCGDGCGVGELAF